MFKRVLQQRGEGQALQAVSAMMQGRVVDFDTALALDAASLSAELQLPLADSIMLASAHAHGATLWTQDGDFRGMAGIRYIERQS